MREFLFHPAGVLCRFPSILAEVSFLPCEVSWPCRVSFLPCKVSFLPCRVFCPRVSFWHCRGFFPVHLTKVRVRHSFLMCQMEVESFELHEKGGAVFVVQLPRRYCTLLPVDSVSSHIPASVYFDHGPSVRAVKNESDEVKGMIFLDGSKKDQQNVNTCQTRTSKEYRTLQKRTLKPLKKEP